MNPFKPDGDEVFLQIPDQGTGTPAKRILHRAKHVGSGEGTLELELAEALELEADQHVFLYYEQRRKFMQQPARVILLSAPCSLEVETTADPILAESRQSYRCATLVEDIHIRLGSEPECEVTDVSQTGLAVLANTTYAPGSRIDATLCFEGEEIEGVLVVQSVYVPPGSRTRYGLRVVAGDLVAGLARVAMAIQRNQLRRRAGN